MSLLSRMFTHMAWADARTLQSLRNMDDPSSQALDLLAHVLSAEHVWMCRIQGMESAYPIWPKLSIKACATLANENHLAYRTLVDEVSGDGATRMITYRNSSGIEFQNSLEDILLHIAEHGAYHRGQVALLVRTSGGNAISTDYIVFSRDATA